MVHGHHDTNATSNETQASNGSRTVVVRTPTQAAGGDQRSAVDVGEWPPTTVPFNAIAMRGGREQYVTVTEVTDGNYWYDYGYISYHEGSISAAGLRPLNEEENLLLAQNRAFSLPQQFYQTGSVYMPPLDTPETYEAQTVPSNQDVSLSAS